MQSETNTPTLYHSEMIIEERIASSNSEIISLTLHCSPGNLSSSICKIRFRINVYSSAVLWTSAHTQLENTLKQSNIFTVRIKMMCELPFPCTQFVQ